MPSPSDILSAIAPELDAVDPIVRDLHLGLAEDQTGKAYKGARDHAVALLAAHTLTAAQRGGASGAVSQLKEGGLSVGFAGREGATDLESTSYGAELVRLRRSYIMTARTVLV
jgi:hypothetical protein